MAGGYRRMSREDGALADHLARFRMRAAALHHLPHTFQRKKCRVAFVSVPDSRGDGERTKQTHPADTQKDFLAQPHLLVPTV